VIPVHPRATKPVRARVLLGAACGALCAAVACGSDGSNQPPENASGAPVQHGGTPGIAGATNGGATNGGATNGGASDPGEQAGNAGLGSSGESPGNGGHAGAGEQVDVGGAAGNAIGKPPPRDYPDVEFVYDPGEPDPLTPEKACALGSTAAVPTPLDMYILFDRSGSMNLPQSMPGPTTPGGGDCNIGESVSSRWCNSINALDGFFRSSAARGAGVALQFFPAGGCTTSGNPFLFACCSSGECCQGAAERAPEVLLANLPDARPALVQALNAAVPWADRTPIEAALRGMIGYTTSARRPGRQMIGLLVTDGGPEGCQSSASTLAKLVSKHRTTTGIPIYVVGTQGAAFSWLESIAEAGGAPAHTAACAGGVSPCHFYNVGSGKSDVFIDVLRQIQREAIACQFAMPEQESGLIDPEQVELSFTPSKSSTAVRLERVTASSACTASGGFFYDDPAQPTQIRLCPSSCEAFRAGDGGKVEVLLGCQGS
jgi:hypothetical protein